jgi:hypothetical protein
MFVSFSRMFGLLLLSTFVAGCSGGGFSGGAVTPKKKPNAKETSDSKPIDQPQSDQDIANSQSGTTTGIGGDCPTHVNLLKNPDFEAGNAGFTTQFVFDDTCGNNKKGFSPRSAGYYSINSTPNVCHAYYTKSSADTGKMLVVNMPNAGAGNLNFFCQKVQVKADTKYKLSVRLRAAVTSAVSSQPTSAAFAINGNDVIATFALKEDWTTYTHVDIPKTSGEVEFCGQARTQNTESTDLLLDDISFAECKQ